VVKLERLVVLIGGQIRKVDYTDKQIGKLGSNITHMAEKKVLLKMSH